jgi:hypothetical protein
VKVKEVVRAALRKISAIESGQEPTPQEYKDCMEALNAMLDSWSADIAEVFSFSREEFTMVAGTSEYTIGSGGDFDTSRPKEIVSAQIKYPGADNEYDVEVVGQDRFDYQTLKTTQGRPNKVFYNPTYPLGKLYFHYTPNAAFTLRLNMKKRLGSYTSINTEISLPEEMNQAMIFNLATMVSDEFGFAVPTDVRREAKNSLNIVKKLNFSNLMNDATLDSMLRGPISRRSRRVGRENIYG